MKNVFAAAWLASLLLLTACGDDAPGTGNDAAFAHIPQGVTSVTMIDVGELMDKMDYEAVQQMGFFQEMKRELSEDGNQVLVDVLDDPESSGIDLDQPIYLVYELDANLSGGTSYALASIGDRSAFDQLVRKSTNATATVADGFSFVQPDRQVIVGYSDDVALIGGSTDYVDLGALATKVFGVTPETGMADNDDLRKALSLDGDVRSWITLDAIADNPQAAMGLGMAQIQKEDLLGNYIHGYTNFENGRLVGHSDLYLKKGLTKDIDKLFKDAATMDVEDYIPGDNLVFVLANSLSFRGLDEVLSGQPFVKGMVNQSLQEYGFGVEDLAATFGGDIVVAGYTSSTDPEKVAGLFVTDLLDEARWAQFQDIALRAGLLTPGSGKRFVLPGGGLSSLPFADGGVAQLLVQDKRIFVSADDALLAQIEGGARTYDLDLDGDAEEVIGEHLFGLWLDMVKLDALAEKANDGAELGLETVTFTADRTDMDFLVTSQESGENFLKTMMQGVEAAYQREQNR